MADSYPEHPLTKRLYREVAGLAAPKTFLADLERVIDRVREESQYIVVTFPEYTPHDFDGHSVGLLTLATRVAADTIERLNTAELAVLVVALLVHDWGMAVSASDREAISSSVVPTDPLLAWDHGGWHDAVRASGMDDDEAWRNYVRTSHAARTGRRVRAVLADVSQLFADAVGAATEGHGVDLSSIRDPRLYPRQSPIFGLPANVAAVSIYVRVLDLLDVAEDRTPLALFRFVAPKNRVSQLEWAKHRALSPVTVSDGSPPKRLLLGGRTNNVSVFARLHDLTSYVEEQFGDCVSALATFDPKYQVDLDRRLDIRIEPDGFIPRLVRIEPDRRATLEMLSAPIYDEAPLSFVRELLQNSVDAIDARASLHESRGSGSSFNQGEITVKTSASEHGVHVEWIDNGIGMTLTIVEQFFARAGVSWYQSTEFRRLDQRGATSRFGIGFLSCFAAADGPIRVETRADPLLSSDAGISIEMPDLHSHMQIADLASNVVGTKIGFDLRPSIDEDAILRALLDVAGFVKFPIHVEGSAGTTVIVSVLDTSSSHRKSDRLTADPIAPVRELNAGDLPELVVIETVLQETHGVEGVYRGFIPANPMSLKRRDDFWTDAEGRTLDTRLIAQIDLGGLYAKGVLAERRSPVGQSHRWIAPMLGVNFVDLTGVQPTLDRTRLLRRPPGSSLVGEAAARAYLSTQTLPKEDIAGLALRLAWASYFLGLRPEWFVEGGGNQRDSPAPHSRRARTGVGE